MRKLVVVLAALMVVAAVGMPATAAKKKKKKPKPVKTTLYMHGYAQTGEMDGADWLANSAAPMSMDTKAPTEANPKSMQYTWAPFNSQCSGLPLVFPTWVGNVQGTITGDVTLTAHFVSTPGAATFRIWADAAAFSCNDAYIAPTKEVRVDIPAGQSEVKVVFKGVKAKALSTLMVEILEPQIDNASPQTNGRVLYDSTDYQTSIAFNCIPPKGKKTCV